MITIGKRFVIEDRWGKGQRTNAVRGALVDREIGEHRSVMEKIWFYLHTTGSHGLMKKSSRFAESRMRMMKRQLC